MKHPVADHAALRKRVAPLAGAWIETRKAGITRSSSGVAPLAGAWIETYLS